MTELFKNKYEMVRVDGLESKYLPFLGLKEYLDRHFPDKFLLGKSFLGKDIYGLKMGSGPIKILAWSQMHGNESTGTKAMLDVWEFLKLKENEVQNILNRISFYFIPMLNPDGSSLFTRRNATGIDLNRDFLREASPEIKILKKIVSQIQPDFLFNLHDQRTIFNVGHTAKPATLSFLAPSPDAVGTETPARIKAMDVIHYMTKELEKIIPGHIARFSDEFYPTSTGDNFMKAGFPCILFEAGHYPNDYQRIQVRKFNALALLLALERISLKENADKGDYDTIPRNNQKCLDIVLRNVLVNSNECSALVDIGIYFEERLDAVKQEIVFNSRIEEIGDLSEYFGHLDMDKKGKIYVGRSAVFPVAGELADFTVGTIDFEKGKFNG